jgi:hypothetical protein
MEFLKRTFFTIIILTFTKVSYGQVKTDGQYKNWSARNSLIDKQLVCFAVSSPVGQTPKNINRAEARLFVSFRSTDKVMNEVSVTSGYTYKPNFPVVVSINKKEYDLEPDDNFAWLLSNTEEIELVNSMKKGSTLKIQGVSNKGTKTEDTFSLAGFSDAYEAAKKRCNFSK